MDIEFSGQYNRDIYRNAIRWIFRPSTGSAILRIVTFTAFCVLYVFYIVNAVNSGDVSAYEIGRIARHLATFLIIGFWAFQPWIGLQSRLAGLWKDPLTGRKLTGRVSTIGVMIDPVKEPIPWDKFIKVNRTTDAITLLTASRVFVLLQRDFFRDDQDWRMVRSIVDTKVQEVIE